MRKYVCYRYFFLYIVVVEEQIFSNTLCEDID